MDMFAKDGFGGLPGVLKKRFVRASGLKKLLSKCARPLCQKLGSETRSAALISLKVVGKTIKIFSST